MNIIEQSISNLHIMSVELERAASLPKNYNTTYGYYLDQLSATMYKNAKELQEIQYQWGL